MRPIAACAMGSEIRTRVSQVTPESPGIPHAMVLRLPSRSPGRPAFLPPSPAKNCFSPTPAPGRQDHDFSVRQPHRPSSEVPASTASRSAFRDVARRPSQGAGRRDRELICHFGKPEYFCTRGLTEGAENRAGDLPFETSRKNRKIPDATAGPHYGLKHRMNRLQAAEWQGSKNWMAFGQSQSCPL